MTREVLKQMCYKSTGRSLQPSLQGGPRGSPDVDPGVNHEGAPGGLCGNRPDVRAQAIKRPNDFYNTRQIKNYKHTHRRVQYGKRGKENHFILEKPDRHDLLQVIKVNINRDRSC